MSDAQECLCDDPTGLMVCLIHDFCSICGVPATRNRLCVQCQLHADLAAVTAERDSWKRAAESQNRQWSAKCTQVTELRAEVEALRGALKAIQDAASKVEKRAPGSRIRGVGIGDE